MNMAKFLRATFFYETPLMAASVDQFHQHRYYHGDDISMIVPILMIEVLTDQKIFPL